MAAKGLDVKMNFWSLRRSRLRALGWGWRMTIAIVAVLLLGLATVGVINVVVFYSGRALMVSEADARPADAAMVLGAYVEGNQVSDVLADRLETAWALYKRGTVKKLLLSGDHGQNDYDEVNSMRKYLLQKGVPADHIFLDHAGFNTYNSMYRARDIFRVRKMIVVTQAFHLPRALWLAQNLGLEVQGVAADRHLYQDRRIDNLREMAARVKAFVDVHRRALPVFLGPEIPIDGDGRATWDQKD